MPASVETMFYGGQVPWHGEGDPIPEGVRYSPGEALIAAGLDWKVKTEPVFLADGREMPCRGMIRESDNSILGYVGPNTVPFQNEQLTEFFRPFIESGDAYFHTGGSLEDGKKVWMLCQMNREPLVIGRDDEVAKFILLSNSHDGKTAIRVGFTPIRVVCANTLAFAHSAEGSKLIRVRHSKQAESNLDAIRDTMDIINADFETTAENYRFLASRDINSADLEKYIKIVLNLQDVDENDIKTRTKNRIAEIVSTVETGPGQDIGRGSYWWAYNGITAYLNHEASRNSHNRLNSLWFGTNATMSQKALDTALALSA